MTTTVNKTSVSRRKPATRVRFEQPSMTDRPGIAKRVVGGVEVIEEQLVYLNPKAGPLKISKLILADGTMIHSCRQCSFTGTRGDCMTHRNAEHGARYGKGRKIVEHGDIVVPERANGTIPQSADEMTIAEIVALMPTIKEFGDLIERLEIERNEAVVRLRTLEQHEHRNTVKINGYDEMRAELLELRTWKKKMVQRLAALGFKLEEED